MRLFLPVVITIIFSASASADPAKVDRACLIDDDIIHFLLDFDQLVVTGEPLEYREYRSRMLYDLTCVNTSGACIGAQLRLQNVDDNEAITYLDFGIMSAKVVDPMRELNSLVQNITRWEKKQTDHPNTAAKHAISARTTAALAISTPGVVVINFGVHTFVVDFNDPDPTKRLVTLVVAGTTSIQTSVTRCSQPD
jgi:hypothetical protein